MVVVGLVVVVVGLVVVVVCLVVVVVVVVLYDPPSVSISSGFFTLDKYP